MKRSFLNIFIIFLLAEFSLAQHDNRYDPFDWIMYLQLGAITSITEGFRYFYIGTEMGGVVRVQSIGQQLDDSITQTQGLKSNEISAVHFDRQTGRLWIIAGNHIHSSHSRVGDWDVESLNYWGLPNRTKILRMGSSKYYVWVHTSSGFVKLDHISGIFLGTFPYPDEERIQWSSSSNYPDHEPNILNEYSLSDGWLSMSNMSVNPYGSNIRQSVFFEGKTGDVVVGMEDGTIFLGNNSTKFLDPIIAGIGNNDVQFILEDEGVYLGGRYSQETHGFTHYEMDRDLIEIIDFDNMINLSKGHYYCAVRTGHEIWFGGDGIISVYNEKESFWRTLDETRGFSGHMITDMVADSQYVWVSSSSGLFRMDQKTKRVSDFGFEHLFAHRFIYDIELVGDHLWIAAGYDLIIIDLEDQKILNHKTIGELGEMEGMEDLLSGFKVINNNSGNIDVSTIQGVWNFNYSEGTWSEMFDASVYAGFEITDMIRWKKYFFIATNDGFIRYDLKDRFIRDYHYDFIGHVHDMMLTKRDLWIGTSNGLIKFKWTKD